MLEKRGSNITKPDYQKALGFPFLGAEDVVVREKSASSFLSESEPCLPGDVDGFTPAPQGGTKSQGSERSEETEEPDTVLQVPDVITRITPLPPPNTAAAAQQAQRFRPSFHGEPNACVIQLFAMDERFEMR